MFGPKRHCVVVVGAQWGDEGKGKIVDVLAEGADLVVRYQGGANAGHTVRHRRDVSSCCTRFPRGILHPGVRASSATASCSTPRRCFAEIDELDARRRRRRGPAAGSDRAHLVLPYHKLRRRARARRATKIGTTGRGIGPAYEDKYGRRGIRVGDLRDLARRAKLVERGSRARQSRCSS